MGKLLDKYEEMQKAAEMDKLAEQRVEVLVKYATLAEEMLEEKFGDKYTEDDVIKVAEFMIDKDLEAEVEQEKIAEYDELGRIMARSYVDELKKMQESSKN